MTDWLKAKFGGIRVSTAALAIAFIALFWVHQTFGPEPAQPEAPPTAVVPPGFVPDPNYTWVPRTNVRRPKEPVYTTTTTTPTTTTTTPTPTTTTPTPTTTMPTTAPTTPPTPTTTVVDPDGFGPLPPQTQTLTPTSTPTVVVPFGPATPTITAPPS